MRSSRNKPRVGQRDGTPEKESWKKRLFQVCGGQQPLLRLPAGRSCKAVVRRKPSVHQERHEKTARRNRRQRFVTPKLEGDTSHSWALIPAIDRHLADPDEVPNAGPDPDPDDDPSGSDEEDDGNTSDASPRTHSHGILGTDRTLGYTSINLDKDRDTPPTPGAPDLDQGPTEDHAPSKFDVPSPNESQAEYACRDASRPRQVSDADLSDALTDSHESQHEDSVTSLSSAPTDVIKGREESDDDDLGSKVGAEVGVSPKTNPGKRTQDLHAADVALRSQDTTEQVDPEVELAGSHRASGNGAPESMPKAGDNQACSSSQLSIQVGGVYHLGPYDKDDKLGCEGHPIIITEIIRDTMDRMYVKGCTGTSHPKLVKYMDWPSIYAILEGQEKTDFETGGVEKPTKADLFLKDGEQMRCETYVDLTESRVFEVSQIRLQDGKELHLTQESWDTLLARKRTQPPKRKRTKRPKKKKNHYTKWSLNPPASVPAARPVILMER